MILCSYWHWLVTQYSENLCNDCLRIGSEYEYLSCCLHSLSTKLYVQVDLRLLQDTVPTDRIVVLRGGWSLFGKGSAGEILVRLTYKSYVEEEEDDRTNVKAIDAEATDDELSDSDELGSFVRKEKVSSDEIGQESFMNVLSALIVSEEFQGIVSSEAEDNKLSGGDSLGAPVPSKAGLDSRSQPADISNGLESSAEISDSELLAENSGRGTGDDRGIPKPNFF